MDGPPPSIYLKTIVFSVFSVFSFFSSFLSFRKSFSEQFGALRTLSEPFGAVRRLSRAGRSRPRGTPPSPDLSKNFSFSGNAVKYQIWMMHLYVHFFSLPPCFETCSFSLLYLHSLSRSLEPWRSQTFAEQVIHISNTGSWDSNMGPTLRSCSEKCGKMWGFNVAPLCP